VDKKLYRVIFTKDLAMPATRSGIMSGYRLLYKDIPYVMTGKFLERLQDADPYAAFELAPEKPLTKQSRSLLLFFPGGIGDVIALRPVLQKFREDNPGVLVAVVSTVADQPLIGDIVSLFDYPITLIMAEQFDAWVNVAEMDRASVGQELQDTFAKFLGLEPPDASPVLEPDATLVTALQGYVKNPDRPRIGIHMDSASHFRSIPRKLGLKTAFLLAEHGYDCYMLGGPENMIVLTYNGKPTAPPEGIYDMTKILGPLEYYIAFLKHIDVLLTCDTGAMHIAGAMSVSTVAIFGMTDGSKRTSYYPSVQYLQSSRSCSPCELITVDPPCEHPWCQAIAEFTPVEIVNKIMEVYRENNAAVSV